MESAIEGYASIHGAQEYCPTGSALDSFQPQEFCPGHPVHNTTQLQNITAGLDFNGVPLFRVPYILSRITMINILGIRPGYRHLQTFLNRVNDDPLLRPHLLNRAVAKQFVCKSAGTKNVIYSHEISWLDNRDIRFKSHSTVSDRSISVTCTVMREGKEMLEVCSEDRLR